MKKIGLIMAFILIVFSGCTQETQNKIGRSIQNWTGTDGVLDVYMGQKLIKRFIKIDKLTTATSTDGNVARNYRYAYGYLDTNLSYGKKLLLPKGSAKKLAKIVYKNLNKDYRRIYYPAWWAVIAIIIKNHS